MEPVQRENAQLQALLDAVAGPALLLAPDGTVLACNRSLSLSTGIPRPELLGRNMLELLPPAIREVRQRRLDQTLATRSVQQWEDERDGRRWLNTMNPVLDAEGEVKSVAVYAQELTRLKALEREREDLQRGLDQARRWRELGQVAGGLAHDLNNILTVILCNATVMELTDVGPDEARISLNAIATAGEQAVALTRKLLTLAHARPTHPRPVQLAAAAAEATGLVERLVPAGITLRPGPIPDDLWVLLDPAHLGQILWNLLTNAAQALRETEGAATVGAKRVEVAVGEVPGLAAGRYALLEVEDEGPGVAPEVWPHLFTPFTTTRGDSGGTGLGLATVLDLAQRNGGTATAESTPGVGACFRVHLPLYEGPLPTPRPNATLDPDKTILLVEDDPALRQLACSVLEGVGYRVVCCGSAEEAIAQEPSVERLDLLLTDVVLRGQDGLALAAILRERRPDLACLFMSGYVPSVLDDAGALSDGAFLPKPFGAKALVDRVVQALG